MTLPDSGPTRPLAWRRRQVEAVRCPPVSYGPYTRIKPRLVRQVF